MRTTKLLLSLIMVSLLAMVTPVQANGTLDETFIRSIEASNQFIDDYNINTTHGFAPLVGYELVSREQAQEMYLPFVLADVLACKQAEDKLPYKACLAAVSEHRFIDAYVKGTLR